MSTPILQLEGIKKSFGKKQVLGGIELSLCTGESTGIIGNNGQGKTTLMRLVLGLIQADTGTVYIKGKKTTSPRQCEQKALFGYLPETASFYPDMTGRSMLKFFCGLKKADKQQVEKLLDITGIAFAADDKIKTYSKGMKQRLALAQSLLGDPEILLLDEPTNGLDPDGIHDFYNILTELKSKGVAILMASHLLSEIESHLDYLAVLKQGVFRKIGKLDELTELSGLPYTIRFSTSKSKMELDNLLSNIDIKPVYDKSESVYSVKCAKDEKKNIIHALMQDQEIISTLSIKEPGLDELFYQLNK
jgi:Cu-processing system ATP-binding protein